MGSGLSGLRIALFGPPGAGKGTQARLLVNRFGITHISTGQILRRAIKARTSVGLSAQSYIERGHLVPDLLVRRLAESAIAEAGFNNFLLDGYPRTLNQARWLAEFLKKNDSPLSQVIHLQLSEEEVIERLSRRRVSPLTGENFHLDYKPPPDAIRSQLVQRPDDTPDAIRQRLGIYHVDTAPVARYYRQSGVLCEINAAGTIDEVHSRVCKTLHLD